MPVHFNSFIANKNEQLKTKIFSDMIKKYTEKADNVFISDDKSKIHMTSYLKDIHTHKKIGKVVITLIVRKDSIEIVDTDITLLSNNKTKLHFEEKLEQSSEANEYYVVYDLEQERHFDVETVNRYIINEEIEQSDREVYLSAFPFQLDIFENEEDMNKTLGLGKKINIPGIGKRLIGMDTRMMSDGRIMVGSTEPCSFIIGEVKSFENVEVDIAGNVIDFKIINLETGIGIMPVAVDERNFNLSKLRENVLIAMAADIKVDFEIN